jgi:hypothetical protein
MLENAGSPPFSPVVETRERAAARPLHSRTPAPGNGPRGREAELLTNSAWAAVRGVTCAGEDAPRTEPPTEHWLPGTSSATQHRQEVPARYVRRARTPEPVAFRKGASSPVPRTPVCARNSAVSSDPPAPLPSIPGSSCRGGCSPASGWTSMRRRTRNPHEQWTMRHSRRGVAPKARRCLACKRAQS